MKHARIAFHEAMEFLFEQNCRFPDLFLVRKRLFVRRAAICAVVPSTLVRFECVRLQRAAVQSIRSVERPERFSASLTIDM
jgi:hypothetical protein